MRRRSFLNCLLLLPVFGAVAAFVFANRYPGLPDFFKGAFWLMVPPIGVIYAIFALYSAYLLRRRDLSSYGRFAAFAPIVFALGACAFAAMVELFGSGGATSGFEGSVALGGFIVQYGYSYVLLGLFLFKIADFFGLVAPDG